MLRWVSKGKSAQDSFNETYYRSNLFHQMENNLAIWRGANSYTENYIPPQR